ncbi:NUDIX hydrolase [Croceicoccus ponticola]|uniref:NUDIX hydrolase n=1 Tax=Croceicoccus ponticola TaxID=2217664 RepID=A0A437GU95_9SPHN|nr:NUDIX domain-containing protein [Croceicoccus ponticola]RVQ64859.1 NUDIX hydrolase [Croceicoccus ponticola]
MPEHAPLAELRAAASLIVFRNGPTAPELLMIHRSTHLAFGGGAVVFPGGRVDPEDMEMAASLPGDRDWNAARITCVRETLEETGLLIGVSGSVDKEKATAARDAVAQGRSFARVLADCDLALDVEGFVPFARWYPPGRATRRFDTRFLLADIGTGAVSLSADGTETSNQFWASATEIMAMGDRGEIDLMFPTRANLARLGALGEFDRAREDSLSREIQSITGIIEEREGRRWLTVPAGHGYPDYAELLETALRGDEKKRGDQ